MPSTATSARQSGARSTRRPRLLSELSLPIALRCSGARGARCCRHGRARRRRRAPRAQRAGLRWQLAPAWTSGGVGARE
jgi:hypothetical protein